MASAARLDPDFLSQHRHHELEWLALRCPGHGVEDGLSLVNLAALFHQEREAQWLARLNTPYERLTLAASPPCHQRFAVRRSSKRRHRVALQATSDVAHRRVEICVSPPNITATTLDFAQTCSEPAFVLLHRPIHAWNTGLGSAPDGVEEVVDLTHIDAKVDGELVAPPARLESDHVNQPWLRHTVEGGPKPPKPVSLQSRREPGDDGGHCLGAWHLCVAEPIPAGRTKSAGRPQIGSGAVTDSARLAPDVRLAVD